MANPLESFNPEELEHYILSLLSQCEARMETKDYANVAWRLADALGAMTLLLPEGSMGLDRFTGLGYRLDVREKPNDDAK